MPNVARLLERQMSPAMLDALRKAGDLAGPYPLPAREAYLVGGPVRDLYLGVAPRDLDLVVVGDGAAFAGLLAERLGARIGMTSEFGTARVETAHGVIDVATARTETYRAPAALPEVVPAGIAEDLARRDFTVNAIAINVLPQGWGEVIDPQSGTSDIARKRLKVMHEASFQDDPTRIFRGIRYSARLGFSFDTLTQELLVRHTRYIDLLTPARLRAEFQKLLLEPARARVLKEAEVWGLLRAISPGLSVSPEALAALASNPPGPDTLLSDLALVTSGLDEKDARSLVARLDPPSEWREIIMAATAGREAIAGLDKKKMAPSEVVALLERVPVAVVQAQRSISVSERVHERASAYLDVWRRFKAQSTGKELIEAGVPEGPAVGVLLAELRTARLDGKVDTIADEIKFVRRRLPSVLKSLAQ